MQLVCILNSIHIYYPLQGPKWQVGKVGIGPPRYWQKKSDIKHWQRAGLLHAHPALCSYLRPFYV